MFGKCELCGGECPLEKHHIHSKCYGGDNKPSNIAMLCPTCHVLVHRGYVILEGRFDSTNGSVLVYHKYNEKSITGCQPKVYLMKGLESIYDK